jgi:hypothetical protein
MRGPRNDDHKGIKGSLKVSGNTTFIVKESGQELNLPYQFKISWEDLISNLCRELSDDDLKQLKSRIDFWLEIREEARANTYEVCECGDHSCEGC